MRYFNSELHGNITIITHWFFNCLIKFTAIGKCSVWAEYVAAKWKLVVGENIQTGKLDTCILTY